MSRVSGTREEEDESGKDGVVWSRRGDRRNTKLSHCLSARSTSRLVFSALSSCEKDFGAYLSTQRLSNLDNLEDDDDDDDDEAGCLLVDELGAVDFLASALIWSASASSRSSCIGRDKKKLKSAGDC